MAFERIWRFRVSSDAASEFERVYGPNGEWSALFARGAGYLGTSLEKIPDAESEFQLVDRWKSREDWDAFRRAFGDEYEELDRRCEELTLTEELVEERDL